MPTETCLQVRLVENNAEREACYALRMRVFVDEQKVPPWEEVDDLDETADHFAVLLDGRIVGTARLVDKGHGMGKIGRVAVDKEARGFGAGKALMLAVMEFGFERFETLALDAQMYVIPFYERLGFVAEGPVFLDAAIEHRLMKKSVRKDTGG
jgi:predicted GNAT family N-acyltransferase